MRSGDLGGSSTVELRSSTAAARVVAAPGAPVRRCNELEARASPMENQTIDTRTIEALTVGCMAPVYDEASGWGGLSSCLMKVRPEGATPIAAEHLPRLAEVLALAEGAEWSPSTVTAVIRDGWTPFVRILGHWWDPAALAFVWPTSIAVVQVGPSAVMIGRVGEELALILVEATPSLSSVST